MEDEGDLLRCQQFLVRRVGGLFQCLAKVRASLNPAAEELLRGAWRRTGVVHHPELLFRVGFDWIVGHRNCG